MLRSDVNSGNAWRFSVDVKYEIHGFALVCASAANEKNEMAICNGWENKNV